MKRLCCLLLALGTGTGCVMLPVTWPAARPEPGPVAATVPHRKPAPVTADDVTEGNARAKAAALKAEMDQADVEDEAPPGQALPKADGSPGPVRRHRW